MKSKFIVSTPSRNTLISRVVDTVTLKDVKSIYRKWLYIKSRLRSETMGNQIHARFAITFIYIHLIR